MNSKCYVVGCPNSKRKCPAKHFFSVPQAEERRQSWIEATRKHLKQPSSRFIVCEDHFDMDADVEFFRMNGTPSLYKTAYPHRNLTSPEMALQAKLDKINWKCFVPSCENKRLMPDRSVVFFAVPDGQLGQIWRAAVSVDKSFSNDSSVSEREFCCEDHFDITKDFYRKFSHGTFIEYTINAGVVPSLNLSDSKAGILNDVKLIRLADKNIHPRVILNNRLTYLFGSKFPQLMQELQLTDSSFVAVEVAVKEEPMELVGTMSEIKTEPMDAGYEFVINSAEPYTHTNPLELELEPKCKSESESSFDSDENTQENNDDPDVTSDDLASTDDDSFEPDSSDDSTESESLEDEATSEDDSDVDTSERFECQYCSRLVKDLDRHVERMHWNFSRNVNRTRCGLCSEIFSQRKDLRRHQKTDHDCNAYACDICDKLERTLDAMRIHILRTHSNERPLLCQHCGKCYKFSRDLKRHEEIMHTDGERQRTHACQQCDKKFFSAFQARKHMNSVHLNMRPYKCDADGCGKAFKQPTHLKVHHAQVHAKENLHSCLVCGKKFSLKSNLTAHLKNVHKN